jgi:uncharacterized protein (TIGR00369 family)
MPRRTRFEARNPDFATRVRSSFARQRVMTFLGATLTRVEPGIAVIELPYRAELSQQHGFFHAGITSTIADSAGGYAAFTLFGVNDSVLTVEYKMNLLAPADGQKLIATGRVVKPGKTLTICQLEVVAMKNGSETLCAIGQQTLICMKNKSDQAPHDEGVRG